MITRKDFASVRVIGLEPTRLAAPDPKSGAAANYATPASVFTLQRRKGKQYFSFRQLFRRVTKITALKIQ